MNRQLCKDACEKDEEKLILIWKDIFLKLVQFIPWDYTQEKSLDNKCLRLLWACSHWKSIYGIFQEWYFECYENKVERFRDL